jgi:uncharacterized YigZ family protein
MSDTPADDVFYTLGRPGRYELKVRGSRFTGVAAPAATREIAERLVESLEKQYYDATHNCYAYRIGRGGGAVFRMSDAGEPSGTAGRPILDAIDRAGLTDTVCVVSRVFGGVKLGTGGLARAYGECAAGALQASEITERFISVAMKVSFGCELTGKVMSLVQKHGCKITKGDFQARTEIRLNVRKSLAERFRLDVINATSGKARFSDDDPETEG